MMNALAASEASRILAENLRRETQSPPHRYALWEPSTLFVNGERRMLAGMMLHKAGVFPHAESKCLEIGFGRMGWLGDLISWGASESQISGLELDPARVTDARRVLPHADLRAGDAVDLPWEDESFDLVVVSLVFTSILSQEVRRLIADNVTRVLRPGGALLWYDFRVDNPRNRNVKGIRRAEILDLFPGLKGDVRSLTLAPPLSRAIVPVSRVFATLLSAIPFLRTHLLAVMVKPKHHATPRMLVSFRTPQVESRPVRSGFLPFALPDLGKDEFDEVQRTLESGWITTGPKTKQFEAEFARVVGARHAIAVNSCTAAMHLALEAIGLRQGDEVITTPYTFTATSEVIRYFGARPVFVDIDPLGFDIDAARIDRVVTRRTKAILPVHVAGLPVHVAAIREIADRHGLRVIEDAAHAFPAKYRGAMIGEMSDFTCFSFYATKTITVGEGGMICTNNDRWAEHCRMMSLHGISNDAWQRYGAEGSWYYEVVAPGYKYNMTDIAAAIGLVQLRKAESMRSRRTEIARLYNLAFEGMPELQIPAERSDSQHSWHLYMLRLNPGTLRIDRAQFIKEMKLRNIGCSVHFIPLHLHPYYRDTYGYKPTDFPVAYGEYQREVSLPIYSRMTDDDVQDVIAAVRDVVEESGARRRTG